MPNQPKGIFFSIYRNGQGHGQESSLKLGIFWEHIKGVSCKIGKTFRNYLQQILSLGKPFIADNCASTPVCSRCILLSVFLKVMNAIIFYIVWAIWIEK